MIFQVRNIITCKQLIRQKKINDEYRISFCKSTLADVYLRQGKNTECFRLDSEALVIARRINDKKRIGFCLLGMGEVARLQGDLPRALGYMQEALGVSESINNKRRVITALTNIGSVYLMENDNEKAKHYYSEALKKAIVLNDKILVSYCTSTLATLFYNEKKYEEAKKYFRQGYELAIVANEKTTQAFCLSSIGEIFRNVNEFDSAEFYLNKSLSLAIENSDQSRIAFCKNSLGQLFLSKKDFVKAKQCGKDGLEAARKSGTPDDIKTSAWVLYNSYKASNNFAEALEMHELYSTMKDSTSNDEVVKKLAGVEYTAKEENLKIEQAAREKTFHAEKAKKDVEIRNQKIIRNAFVLGFLLLSLLAFVIFRSLQQNKKAGKIIELQKENLERKNVMIEEKQKEILDSINYAKRIQFTLLAHDGLLKENFTDHFVLFKPKDIVSGDFYWATRQSGRFYLALCDSTGHGVPGAFMSLLNISFLNEAITEKKISKPDEVLNYVRDRLVNSVSKDGAQDGMDGILICFEPNKITYAAALNRPVLIQNNELMELEADKMPIGKGEMQIPFALHDIKVMQGDMLYLFTDGYADQFGGPKGKKFKYKQFHEKLIAISEKKMQEQKMDLENTLSDWRGNLEQVDDICIIGIKI